MKDVNSVLDKNAKDISVKVYTEDGVAERKVYSDAFLLYTDYEVYSDAEYTNPMTADNGCFKVICGLKFNLNIHLYVQVAGGKAQRIFQWDKAENRHYRIQDDSYTIF